MKSTTNSSRYWFLVFLLDTLLIACCGLGVYRAAQRAAVPVTAKKGQTVFEQNKLKAEANELREDDKILLVNNHLLSKPKDIDFLSMV